MKFIMSMIAFLVLVAVAFYVGYKTETGVGAGAGNNIQPQNSGGVHFGSGTAPSGSLGAPKRCAVSGARC